MGAPVLLCMSGGESTLGKWGSVLDKSTEMSVKILKCATWRNKARINITSARKDFHLGGLV